MLFRIVRRMKRAVVTAVPILLFSIIISVILCAMQASNDAEVRRYEELRLKLPVTMTVTSPTGGDLPWIAPWVYYLFSGDAPVKAIYQQYEFEEFSLAEYVKDVSSYMTRAIDTINGKNYTGPQGTTMLNGVSYISSDKRLLPEYGCEINWYEGYDESILASDELVCLVPESKSYDNGKGEAELYLTYTRVTHSEIDNTPIYLKNNETQCTLKIVGTYTGGDKLSIYCPLAVFVRIIHELDAYPTIHTVSVTLADNDRLEEFREKMSTFFTEPKPDGDKIPHSLSIIDPYLTDRGHAWEYSYDYYSYGLDIKEQNLDDVSSIVENSIRVNRIVTIFVNILSAAAGFLVGFLMIRRRKREIMLMRTIGEANIEIFVGFALEQMLCMVIGAVVGGAYYMWRPADKLVTFVLIYLVGLSLALAIFMGKKLIKNIKEDE